MATLTRVGIVVVTWNSERFIADCLVSIPEVYRSATVVVDNGSRDRTVEIVRQDCPYVQLLTNSVNAGYARATNQGLAALGVGPGPGISPEFVLLLNPDTRLPAQAIEQLSEFLAAHPEAGAVAPKLVNQDGTPQPSVRRFPRYCHLLSELTGRETSYRMAGFDFNQTQEVEQPMASCLLVRRVVFDQVGLLDERLPLFFNDVDFSRRMADAGWKTYYYPEVAVWHYRGGSTELVGPGISWQVMRDLFRYFQKHDHSGWFWLWAIPLWLGLHAVAALRVLVRRPRA